jgi:hypothetical protein
MKLFITLVMTAWQADCQCKPCSCRYMEEQRPTIITRNVVVGIPEEKLRCTKVKSETLGQRKSNSL